MSFILDALKKSETERQQQGDAAFASVPTTPRSQRPPTWLWILGALLLVNLVVLTGLLLRPSPGESVTSMPAATAPAAASGAELAEPQPVSTPPASSPADSFADEVRSALRDQPTTASVNRVVESADPPAPLAETVSRPAPSEATVNEARGLPDIDQLRSEGLLQVGDLRLDIHVYSDVPEDRFVFINMVKHREGSVTADGLSVRTITREGVILDYRGQEFVLPRQ